MARGMAHLAAQGITHGALTTKSVMFNVQNHQSGKAHRRKRVDVVTAISITHRSSIAVRAQHMSLAAPQVMHGEDLNKESDVCAYAVTV